VQKVTVRVILFVETIPMIAMSTTECWRSRHQ